MKRLLDRLDAFLKRYEDAMPLVAIIGIMLLYFVTWQMYWDVIYGKETFWSNLSNSLGINWRN